MAKGNAGQTRRLREQRFSAPALPEPPLLPAQIPQTVVLPGPGTVRAPRFSDSGIEVPAALPEPAAGESAQATASDPKRVSDPPEVPAQELAVPEGPRTIVWTVDYAQARVMDAYGRSVLATIETGQRLTEAREHLQQTGQRFGDLVANLPFGERMAELYMQAAETFAQVLASEPKRVSGLPTAVGTLAVLAAGLELEILGNAIDARLVNPELTRKGAQVLVKEITGPEPTAGKKDEKKDDDQAPDTESDESGETSAGSTEAGSAGDPAPAAEKPQAGTMQKPAGKNPAPSGPAQAPAPPVTGGDNEEAPPAPDITPQARIAALETENTTLKASNTRLEKQVTRLEKQLAGQRELLDLADERLAKLQARADEQDQAARCGYGHELTCPVCARTGYDDR